MNRNLKKYSPWITLALFLACVLTAFLFRTWHYNTSVRALEDVIGDVPAAERSGEPGFLPRKHKNFTPFTIESAMMYTYAQDIALGKGVPASDPLLNGQEDLAPYEQMHMGLEWFLGYGWRLKNAVSPDPEPTANEKRFQDHPAMAQWMSAQLRLWASLTSGLIFLWLIVLRCPKILAFGAGLLHAVAPAAIARATGQDIVRGEFTIPLILASFVLAHWIYVRPKFWKYPLLFAATFLAFATWDLCQMLFGCWAVFEILRFTLGRRMSNPRLYAWIAMAAAIVSAALLIPFDRTYRIICSPTVCAALPTLFLTHYAARKWFRGKRWVRGGRNFAPVLRALVAVGCFALLYSGWNAWVNTEEYASIYSHFSEAMKAKIQYWNEKPLNPEKLSYDARILWTPEMNSATWPVAESFFPGLIRPHKVMTPSGAARLDHISGLIPVRFLLETFPVSWALFLFLLIGSFWFTPVRRSVRRGSGASLLPILFTLGFFAGFAYIVRYHEFLIVFLILSIALLTRDWVRAFPYRPAEADPAIPWTGVRRMRKTSALLRFLPSALFVFLLLHEAGASYERRRNYTGDVAMKPVSTLIEWFRREPEKFKGQGVAANLTFGPMLRAYAGTGVVMNPQFGLKRLRDATEDFLAALYHGTDADLAAYCERCRARYVVFPRVPPDEMPVILTNALFRIRDPELRAQAEGVYTNAWVYSNRYIANALNIPPNGIYREFFRASDPVDPGPEPRHFIRVEPPADLASVSAYYAVFRVITPGDCARAEVLLKLGVQAAKNGRIADAERLYGQALALDPKLEQARWELFRLREKTRPGSGASSRKGPGAL